MNDRYLPQDTSLQQSADAILHMRNKTILIEPRRRTVWYRTMHLLWRVMTRARNAALGAARASVILSEQAIENPFLLRRIDPTVRKVLDFGAFESTLPLSLAALGLDVTVVDQRRYPFGSERLRVLEHDILQPLDSLDSDFDLVYSISTVEHVGLGDYGDPVHPEGDRIALANLWEKVRPGGQLVVSVPAGRPTVQRGYRVYDEPSLRRVLPHAAELSFFMKRGREGVWQPSDAAAISDHRYQDYFAQSPCEAVAIAVLRKPA